MTTKIHLIYSTFASKEEALSMATNLLSQGLIACANLSSPITSVYSWEGRVTQEDEIAVLFKTATLKDAVAYITTHHPYDTPCIISWEAEANPAFAAFVNDSTIT
jgi:periplasmic divalent cation tolerance protein